jgi:hypothetical protein
MHQSDVQLRKTEAEPEKEDFLGCSSLRLNGKIPWSICTKLKVK